MSEWWFQVQPRTQTLITFHAGPLRELRDSAHFPDTNFRPAITKSCQFLILGDGGPNYTKFFEKIYASSMLPSFILHVRYVAQFWKWRASKVQNQAKFRHIWPPFKKLGRGGRIMRVVRVRSKPDYRRLRWKYQVSDRFLRFEATMRQKRLVQGIEAKFGTL